MIQLRKSEERGHADHGWLNAYHTFSFADYYDENHMGFRDLRVINEDRILGGSGFSTHGHQDMEIITYIIEGALEHKDSMGNAAVIRPGEVQRMSAGTGVRHSEFNHLKDQKTHLMQIWILPEHTGIKPSYEQKSFVDEFKNKNFVLVASKEGKAGSVTINQNVNMYVGKLAVAEELKYTIQPGRHVWLQMVKGELILNTLSLRASDAAAISNETEIKIKASQESEFILFDLA